MRNRNVAEVVYIIHPLFSFNNALYFVCPGICALCFLGLLFKSSIRAHMIAARVMQSIYFACLCYLCSRLGRDGFFQRISNMVGL